MDGAVLHQEMRHGRDVGQKRAHAAASASRRSGARPSSAAAPRSWRRRWELCRRAAFRRECEFCPSPTLPAARGRLPAAGEKAFRGCAPSAQALGGSSLLPGRRGRAVARLGLAPQEIGAQRCCLALRAGFGSALAFGREMRLFLGAFAHRRRVTGPRATVKIVGLAAAFGGKRPRMPCNEGAPCSICDFTARRRCRAPLSHLHVERSTVQPGNDEDHGSADHSRHVHRACIGFVDRSAIYAYDATRGQRE